MTITAEAERDSAMTQVATHAGHDFHLRACEFVLGYLASHKETPGEDLTLACRAAGIVPHDDRAFGSVFQRLARIGAIEKCGMVPRKRGHLTSGGNVWRLVAVGLKSEK